MSDKIRVKQFWENATEGYMIGDSGGFYETWCESIGELFSAMQREYGRCISKVYVDNEEGNPEALGWVFEQKEQYTDTKEDYIQHTWVEVEGGF